MDQELPPPPKPPITTNGNSIYIKKPILITFVILLFIAANISIYTIYRVWSQKKATPASTTKPTNIPSPTGRNIVEVGPEAPRVELLRTIPTTASDKEKKTQDELLMNNKRDTAIIFIEEKCKTSPTVANLVGIKKMKISNEDSTKHTLTVDQQHSYPVEAKTMTSIDLNSFKKETFYSYHCDNTSEVSGYFYIPN